MIFLSIIIACLLGIIVGLNSPMISYTYSSFFENSIISTLDSIF